LSLFSELKRRNVFRMAVAYVAGSWLLVQVIETLLPVFEFDDTVLRYVVIVLAIGLIPALAISWAFEWTPDGLKREQDSGPKTDGAKAQVKAWDRIIFVVMALALGLFAFDRFVLSPQREAALIESATEAGAEMERAREAEIPHESVAVLPFVNMSGDPENEYFSDGLTETLLHMLAQLADLNVAARTSSFAFKGQNADIRTIATSLSVAHVLEGSVQKAGDRVRVTAQLIRADDGYHVWSQNYDRTLVDIFAIQDEIAADVASALGSSLLGANDGAVIGLFTNDVDAYDIYLKALEQQAMGTFDALSKAEDLLNRALLADSSFVDAKLALLRNNFLKFYAGTGEFDITSVISTRLISEILAEAPGNLAARQYDLRLRAVLAGREMDLLARRDLMDQLVMSFQEGFGDPFVRADAVKYLINESRQDEALQLLREALVSDPLNVNLLKAQADLLWATSGPDAAEQPLKTALTVEPDNPVVLWKLGLLEFNRKNTIVGLRYLRRSEIVDPLDPAPTHEITLTLTELGLYDEAERWMADYKSRATNQAAVINLEVHTAAERGDEAALRRIVPAAVHAFFEGELDGDISIVVLREYATIMLKDGRAQQGLDYVESYFPGISAPDHKAVTGWKEMDIRTRLVGPLLHSLSDDETNRRRDEALLAFLEQRGIVIGENHPVYVHVQYSRHGLEAAKAAFLSIFTDKMYILSFAWHDFKRAIWAEELRSDPDVQAVLAERELKIAVLREQLREMMREPEWQVQ
jgi:TolB-like protein